MPSTSNGVAYRSEKPENQSDDEQNHSDCPHNCNPRKEPNDEKNQTAKYHDASSSNTCSSYR